MGATGVRPVTNLESSLTPWPPFWCAVLTALLAVSDYLPAGKFFTDADTYLPFHTAFELLAILVSFMVFTLSWNLREQSGGGQGLIIGIGFLIVSIVDLAHSLSFQGMPNLITPSGTEKAINFWLVGRAVAALTLFTVAVWQPPRWSSAAAFAGLCGAILFSIVICWFGIVHPEWWPHTFVTDQGLTPFKIDSEYAIALVYAISALLLCRRAIRTRNEDVAWLAAAAWVLGLAELFFTLYARVTDLYNFLGHTYKALAYFMVYRALFVAGVRAPYRLLALERARLRSIITTIPDLVWVKDPKGVYLFCNPAFEKLFGAPEAEIIGKTDYDFVDRSVADMFREMDALAVKRGGPSTNEESLTFKSGKYVGIFETTKTPIFDEKDAVIGVLGISHDVTEAKRIQEELAAARDNLEEQVNLRTAQLREAKEAAESASLAKASFLANMSHEIRTPMNAVLGMAHLALSADPPPRVKDYLRKIMASGQHLLGIINEILDFSKIDAGKMEIEKVEFSLEDVFRDAVELVAERCSQKGIELVVDLGCDVPKWLVGDPLRVEQVLVNYLNNAAKFTERGEIVLGASVKNRRDSEVTLRFEVRDTGIGIGPDQRRHLFQAFQQVDSSTTRKYGGTGLGLVIAKRLAEAMGGEVGVESELGVGSTFWFTAKLALGEAGRNETTSRKSVEPHRILVVDDNEHARQTEAGILQSVGFVPRTAGSGPDALAEIRRSELAGEPYDVVLLDWKMPDMDGVAVVRELGEMALGQPPRIIMITAFDQDELRAAASGLGVSAFLTKPATASTLFDTLTRLLGNRLSPRGSDHAAGSDLDARAQSIRGARALVVEDNELNQEVAVGILNEFGLTADVASHGEEALRRIAGQRYDVILMDVQMPVMDGIAATLRIRETQDAEHLPIIAMTASVLQSDRDRCLAAGMNDQVSKPIEPGALLDTLLKWIRPRTEGDASAEGASLGSGGQKTDEAIPAGIAGLDTAQGLRRVAGNRALYLSLLKKFTSGQRTTADEIGRALANGDWPLAERLAHTLKSVSGNIGAIQIAETSAALETTIREGRPVTEIEPRLAVLGSQIAKLVAGLVSGPSAESPRDGVSIDQAKLEAVYGHMCDLLAQNEAEAAEVFVTNAALLAAAFPDHYARLETAVGTFDFDQALATLRAAWDGRSTDGALP